MSAKSRDELSARAHTAVRIAQKRDAEAVGRLLHEFQIEFADETPGPAALAERICELIGSGETVVLLAGEAPPEGLAVLRLRPSIFRPALECYLAELYVTPERRGRGLGRALMEASVAEAKRRGADHMDLGTSEADVAARGLYESLGFINRENGSDGPIAYFYERDI
jgi:ribosomal protein S18 acetylase RimI-like enzyme